MAQSTKSHGDGGDGGKVFYLIGAVIVIAGIAWLFAVRGGGLGSSASLPTPAEFEGLAATIEADPSVGISLGPESAPIEILEFADYSCPHCASFAGFAGKLLRQNYVETADGSVRWVLYDFVLGGFPNSLAASMAARCAGEQGAYWPMHDMLFSRQTRWYTQPSPTGELNDIAGQVGLDMGGFRSCMSEGRYIEQIAAARKYGEQLGVASTPTLFFNGQKLDLGASEPYSLIEGLIKAELAAAGQETTDTDGGP